MRDIFAHHVSNERLISRIHKELLQLKKKTTTHNPIKKWAKDINRHFSKEDVYMAKKHMKRCSTSLLTRETQIKTKMSYHFLSIRMAIIKLTEITVSKL